LTSDGGLLHRLDCALHIKSFAEVWGGESKACVP
jgi:hypothetical protein